MASRIQSFVILGLLCLIIFFLFDTCNKEKLLYDQSIEIQNYQDTILEYEDKNGKLVGYNKALQVSEEAAYDAIKGLEQEIEDLKLNKPDVVIKYRNRVQIDSVEIHHDIPCEEFRKPFYLDSTYYSIKGVLTDKSLLFEDIIVPNNQTFVVAEKREKWYKRREYVVVVKNDNPYVMSEGIQSYTIKPTQKFYEKWYFQVGVGVIGGYLLNDAIK